MLEEIIMRAITLRLFIALLAFVIGITAFSFESMLWRSARKINKAEPVLDISLPAINVSAAHDSGQSQADGEPRKIKDLEITSANLKEEDARSSFKIDIEYPQI